ncbi:hypothetical protein ES319_D05G326300v1 [Gossypium barbadense]|uniref:CLASP N-terminal domain-containing protein n=1 Tax=Gossypium barbadense TaxID=3634 RepID=A0A5J5RKS0_GOSBA|nr:hypothetical protein ES319_D05G326300v1 [Gossypium barbadense]
MFFKKTVKYVGEPMTHLESIASSVQLKKSLSSIQINGGETLNVQHNKSSASVQINGGETVNVGVEVANSEVEYIESENLSDLEDVDTCLKKLLPGLDSKDWILIVETLNNVRRLSVFHKERMHCMLGDLIPLVVKSLKNPRMSCRVEGIKAYGIDKLIQLAASQLSDQLPESRKAARTLLLELQTVYEKSHSLSTVVSENPEMGSWEKFCLSKLSPLSAQAVLRVTTNIAREGLVIGS